LIKDLDTGVVGVIDPSLSAPVQKALDDKGGKLDYILNTHHHYDHTDGNLELKMDNGAKVVGSSSDYKRVPGIDIKVSEKEEFMFGNAKVQILEVDGHTKGHVAYFFPETNVIFTGDVLFSLGCGGMFEGTPFELWESLKKIRDTSNDETLVYPGHEYTLHCAGFVYAIDGSNPDLMKRLEQAAALANAGKPTIPVKMGVERRTNPYLRLDDPEFQAQYGLKDEEPARVMNHIQNL
jgi:hydroxyacylglutathione hydrolase